VKLQSETAGSRRKALVVPPMSWHVTPTCPAGWSQTYQPGATRHELCLMANLEAVAAGWEIYHYRQS